MVGFVVTPSRTPQRAAILISSISAVSRKIFIGEAPVVQGGAFDFTLAGVKTCRPVLGAVSSPDRSPAPQRPQARRERRNRGPARRAAAGTRAAASPGSSRRRTGGRPGRP